MMFMNIFFYILYCIYKLMEVFIVTRKIEIGLKSSIMWIIYSLDKCM